MSSPVVEFTVLRLLLALSALKGFRTAHLDVNYVVLFGNVEEEIHFEQPKGFEVLKHQDYACRILKSFYGLKQAPRIW